MASLRDVKGLPDYNGVGLAREQLSWERNRELERLEWGCDPRACENPMPAPAILESFRREVISGLGLLHTLGTAVEVGAIPLIVYPKFFRGNHSGLPLPLWTVRLY